MASRLFNHTLYFNVHKTLLLIIYREFFKFYIHNDIPFFKKNKKKLVDNSFYDVFIYINYILSVVPLVEVSPLLEPPGDEKRFISKYPKRPSVCNVSKPQWDVPGKAFVTKTSSRFKIRYHNSLFSN